MRITAAVTEEKSGPFVIQQLDIGELSHDEILVEVAAAGICHTDLIVRDQWLPVPLPAVLGHEGAGVVSAVGSSVTQIVPGDRVGMTFDSCGHCATCLGGKRTYCHDFFGHNFASARSDGSTALSRDAGPVHSHFFGQSSFATHAVATVRNTVKLPAWIPFEVAAPFGCGIQTGAGAIFNTLRPPAGSSLAVFGTGAVGLSAIIAGAVTGCAPIIGIDVRPTRLELARELGASHTIDASTTDVIAEIAKITGGGANFTVETSGVTSVLRTAVDSLAPAGVCGVIGAPPGGSEVALDVNMFFAMGKTLRGIVEGDSIPELFLPRLFELWRAGRFPVDRFMVDYDFEQINEAAHDAEQGATIKPVLRMSS